LEQTVIAQLERENLRFETAMKSLRYGTPYGEDLGTKLPQNDYSGQIHGYLYTNLKLVQYLDLGQIEDLLFGNGMQKLGGVSADPWIAEFGINPHIGNGESSTIDLISTAGLFDLYAGDFVEATIEHVVLPLIITVQIKI
jgi:hypothetical protein